MIFTSIEPMLLTMRYEAFDDENYIFEPKWDGWRILIHKQGGRIEAYTRQGNCVTRKFPELEAVRDSIKAESAILDCEGVCIRDGRSVFDDFAYRGRLTQSHKIQRAMSTHPATFVAFDVLYANGDVLTNKALMERKDVLHSIVEPSDQLTSTPFFEGNGIALKAETERRNWEGIVAKRRDSLYEPGVRSADWIKIKNWKQLDTVILGYRTEPQFGLVVGLHFPTMTNKPVAVVEYGMSQDQKKAFLMVAKGIQTEFDSGVQWIEPRLCCRVQYLERTERHQLRTVSFKGFQFNKDPKECRWVS
ncbi:DNA ligase [Alicyclobacillus sp. SP_1]|uniref:ATP-dependent DNA ligase n=1 Tax=Alicyclobacillus sp. SP_1 TaxID=2942475 RepID=UPI002157DE43|nr:DNA ligase [Alicyclobacillus sp. SP_1]